MFDFALTNPHAVSVVILIVTALTMFAREKVPYETTCLFVLAALTLGFELFPFVQRDGNVLKPSDFLLGFGHKALVAVCGLMIIGEGLTRTGALEPVGRLLGRMWKSWPAVSLLATILVTAALSMVINDTPVVVLLLPILLGVALRTGKPPSRFLIPMGFAAILGGMATTIGTSTNLLVVTVAEDMGMARFGMFEFTGLVAIAALFAVPYLWLVAPRLLPDRVAPISTRGVSRMYTAQVRLDASSPVVGRTMAEAFMRVGENMQVEAIQRGPGVYISPLPDVVLREGDRISICDTHARLREFTHLLGGKLYSGDQLVDLQHPLRDEGQKIAEVAITSASQLVGVAIGEARLISRFGLRLLAFSRGQVLRGHRTPGLDEVELESGDVLLVQSTQKNLDKLKSTPEFLVLDGGIELPSTRKAPLALFITAAVVTCAALGLVPIETSALLGCLAMIVLRCMTWKEAMNALDARVILIVVASLAMGAALMKTGGADMLATGFVSLTFGAPPWVVLAGVMLMISILTNIVSNNAAAVIGTPIAVGIAQSMGLPLEPFVLAVLFSANLSFVTPMGYQTNLLIMNAGGYRFSDFVRVGLPLALLLMITLTSLLVAAYNL